MIRCLFLWVMIVFSAQAVVPLFYTESGRPFDADECAILGRIASRTNPFYDLSTDQVHLSILMQDGDPEAVSKFVRLEVERTLPGNRDIRARIVPPQTSGIFG